jgi:hypothetical protein
MNKCYLCDDGLPPRPDGWSYRDQAYVLGFADGARSAQTSLGPHLCEKHQQGLRDALAARGLRVEFKKK